MWAATFDFTKAFDSITHKSIWNALKSCNIEHEYIRFLKKRYRDRHVRDKKGPSTVLQKALENIPRWQKKKGV